MPVDLVRFESLKRKAKQDKHLVYLWDQAADPRIKTRGGVCLGMCMDWLRRKMAGGKNFDHADFASQRAKVTLATQHISIHDIQLKAPATALTLEYARQMAALGYDPKMVNARFLHLADKDAQTFGWKELQAHSLPKHAVDKADPADAFTSAIAAGLFDLEDEPKSKYQGMILQLHCDQKEEGHAVAFFIRDPLMSDDEARRRNLNVKQVYEFFDPNVGELHFAQNPKGLIAVLSELWAAVYSDLPQLIPHQVWYRT